MPSFGQEGDTHEVVGTYADFHLGIAVIFRLVLHTKSYKSYNPQITIKMGRLNHSQLVYYCLHTHWSYDNPFQVATATVAASIAPSFGSYGRWHLVTICSHITYVYSIHISIPSGNLT